MKSAFPDEGLSGGYAVRSLRVGRSEVAGPQDIAPAGLAVELRTALDLQSGMTEWPGL